MSDKEPDIHEIVNALTTWHERQEESVREIRDAHHEQVRYMVEVIDRQNREIVRLKDQILKGARKAEEPEPDPADTDPSICRYACTHPVADHGESGCKHSCPCLAGGVQPTPVADDKEAKCRVCGHDEDRHSRTLPEEGYEEYCAECDSFVEFHEFDGSKPQPDDMCRCGHRRDCHRDILGTGGAQCELCPGGREKGWRHDFVMRVPDC